MTSHPTSLNDQLELNLDGSSQRLPSRLRKRQPGRAQWWFHRMHEIVENALDWEPPPPPRPVQTGLPSLEERHHLAKAA